MLQQCCPFIVTGLGHPILLITGLSSVRGPHAQSCPLSWLLGERLPQGQPPEHGGAEPLGQLPLPSPVLSYPQP